ncbi:exodeoxyribonuclease VII large subunit [Hathewaya histolytica]|uniref:Exodeoxyribonuclease 7 large subunit n=1 Tax=Hathewaya histolytica TaxID=1498 RepID=A0A4U9RHD0_HATHI|nr:exodeoxyribonuclease VII large subunit [Hathewaya histolytica]VTQ88180.1 exodeoxyribonuclease VII large subunit [Hathewaya histolytica]
MLIKVLTVSNLNNYIKKSFDNDVILNNVYVKGELSNFKVHSSGHIYFSIKDSGSKLNCIMFRDYANTLKFTPKEGDKVVVKGRVSVYEKEGYYQLYAREIELEGIGELYYEFNLLKEKLKEEGLFEERHKKALPLYPKRIGVITSPTGAAVRDIINVSLRRNPKTNILIYPSLVQGDSAPENLIKGIKYLNNMEDIDLIILARGGGSIEELWAFNNEKLAYAIHNSKKPIISGVGHETDFTISDFVSDMRAATPSAAAEIAVPSYTELKDRIFNLTLNLNNNIVFKLREEKDKVSIVLHKLKLQSPKSYIVNQYEYIDFLISKLNNNIDFNIGLEKENLIKNVSLLDAHNPYNVLKRGYSILQDKNFNIINSKEQLSKEKEVLITLKDGKIKLKIEVVE